jgi:hypothetical protein
MARDLRVVSIPGRQDGDPVPYFIVDRLAGGRQIAGPFATADEANTMIRESRQAGDRAFCPKCRAALVFVSRRGLWACDAGTLRRHACLDDRRRA